MDTVTEAANRRRIGRRVVIGVVVASVVILLLVVYQINHSPRTDDASVWANYIEISSRGERPAGRASHQRQYLR